MADDLPDLEQPPPTTTKIRVPFQEDEEMLLCALTQAGLWAYGVKSVEVWVLNEHGTLSLPLNGSWIDHVFYQNSEPEIAKALQDIEAQLNDYMNNGTTLAPGVGIPGILWSSSKDASSKKKKAKSSRKLSLKKDEKKKTSNIVVWRNLKAITRDPDQPYNPHAIALGKAGFSLCAGVPFHTRGCDGIVVYFARDSVERDKLTSVLNEEYILSATEYVGAILGFVRPRKLCMKKRKEDARLAFQKVRAVLNMVTMDTDVDAEIKNNYQSKLRKHEEEGTEFSDVERPDNWRTYDVGDVVYGVKSFWKTWFHKMLGGNVMPPPVMEPSEVVHSFVASFITFITMAYINTALNAYNGYGENVTESDDNVDTQCSNNKNLKSAFIMGAVGSLMTVVYGLMSAPASQPRSIILGQGASALIGIICSFIPVGEQVCKAKAKPVSQLVRNSLAVALSASFMGAAGITHPPGSSIVLQFTDGDFVLLKFGYLCLANFLVAILAASFNNLSPKRLYPTYWGYLPRYVARRLREIFCDISSKDDSKHHVT